MRIPTSAPAKTVKTHGDWVIAWEALIDATLFIFKHQRLKLQLYGRHIQWFFASIPSQHHSHVINYDQVVRIRVAQQRDLELTDFAEFSNLRIQWINVQSTSGHAPLNTDNSRSLIGSPMMHANNGMTKSARIQQHCATMCMFASSVEAAPMSGKSVQLQPGNKLFQL